MGIIERLRNWTSWDDAWERPRPAVGRADLLLAVVVLAVGWLNIEAMLSYVATASDPVAPGWRALALGSAVALLVLRRRFPVVTMLLLGVHFYLTANVVPEVGYTMVYQLIPFLALYSGFAWARDRKLLLVCAGALLLGLTVWLVWMFALGRAMEGFMHGSPAAGGLFSPSIGVIIVTTIANVIYFFAAALMGQVAWRQARDHAEAISQAETIARQSDQIAEHAVTAERLRLARELHDVVAHHISLMGVQAGAARTVLAKDPALAAQALANVEQASRDAVAQMRGLLGTLRSTRDDDTRAPEPGLSEVPALVDAARSPRFAVQNDLVVAPGCDAESLPLPVGLTIYRTVQESLANVRRHSTARSARVVVRIAPDSAEVEVTDDGTARGGTAGSGFGQQGIRERAASLGGQVEMGPRSRGGYRVRVRLPLQSAPGVAVPGLDSLRA